WGRFRRGNRRLSLKGRSAMSRKNKKLPPIHPGEMLRDVMEHAGLSANALAAALHVPPNRITAILKGERGITGDTALRLSRYFKTSATMWMTLQARYDLQVAEDEALEVIERDVLPRPAA